MEFGGQVEIDVAVGISHLDVFEVQVLQDFGGPQLRAVIELVSPANKDGHPQASAIKCASYLQRGVSVVIVVVTDPPAFTAKSRQTLRLNGGRSGIPETNPYAVAYRVAERLDAGPRRCRSTSRCRPCRWLNAELCLPLEFDETYAAACESLRIRMP